MSVLIFLVILVVLILVHELGHFLVAKWSGMRVDEFGIGFPPRIASITKGETRYSLNALPIGGFVKIHGEDGLVADGVSERDPRSFAARPRILQALVLVAGVAMNILLAWVLLIAVYMIGVPSMLSEDAALTSDTAELVVTDVLPESPAAVAGVPVGASIVSVDDESVVPTPQAFQDIVQRADEPLAVTYRSSGELTTTYITPADGVVADTDAPAIGVALASIGVTQSSVFAAIGQATTQTVSLLGAITVGITTFIIDAFQLSADFSSVAGPVGIVGLVGDAAAFGIASLLFFTAFISLNLAVINMLPFPALDGGRLVIVGIESVLRREVNPVWVARVNALGFALLILLMVAVTYNDIARLI